MNAFVFGGLRLPGRLLLGSLQPQFNSTYPFCNTLYIVTIMMLIADEMCMENNACVFSDSV